MRTKLKREKKKRSWTKLELTQTEMSYFQDCCAKRKALESDASIEALILHPIYKEYELSFPSWENFERLTNLTCP